jgi:hypothetical protein
MYAAFRSLQVSSLLMAAVDSVLTIIDQWGTAAALLIYLGVAPQPLPKPAPAASKSAQKRSRR